MRFPSYPGAAETKLRNITDETHLALGPQESQEHRKSRALWSFATRWHGQMLNQLQPAKVWADLGQQAQLPFSVRLQLSPAASDRLTVLPGSSLDPKPHFWENKKFPFSPLEFFSPRRAPFHGCFWESHFMDSLTKFSVGSGSFLEVKTPYNSKHNISEHSRSTDFSVMVLRGCPHSAADRNNLAPSAALHRHKCLCSCTTSPTKDTLW